DVATWRRSTPITRSRTSCLQSPPALGWSITRMAPEHCRAGTRRSAAVTPRRPRATLGPPGRAERAERVERAEPAVRTTPAAPRVAAVGPQAAHAPQV